MIKTIFSTFLFFFIAMTISAQDTIWNELRIEGGYVKTVVMGNRQVDINNYYYPEVPFRDFLKDIKLQLNQLPGKITHELKNDLNLIFENKILLLDSLSFYKSQVKILKNQLTKLKIEDKKKDGIIEKAWKYFKLSESVIEGAESLKSDGYKVIKTSYDKEKKYAFNKEKILSDPTRMIIFQYKNGVAIAKKSNKFGLIDLERKLITELKYDSIQFFPDTFVLVKKNQKYGLITLEGSSLVKPIYDSIGTFSDGLALVKKDNLYGYIDAFGRQKISIQYHLARGFKKGVAAVIKIEDSAVNQKWFFIDKSGKKTTSSFPLYYNLSDLDDNEVAIACPYFESCGLIDRYGQLIIKDYNFYKIKPAYKDFYAVLNFKRKWGLINKTGELIIEPKYKDIQPFVSGKIIASIELKNKNKILSRIYMGVIDKNELEIIPLVFDRVIRKKNFFIATAKLSQEKSYSFLIDDIGNCISGNKENYLSIIRERRNDTSWGK